MKGLSFDYPAWYLVLCLLLGVAAAALLYYREQALKESPSWVRSVMAVLRALAISIIAALLLSPVLRTTETRTQRPVVVLAQDGSESVTAHWRSGDSARYVQQMQDLRSSLGENFEVVSYTFGDAVRDTMDFAFRDKLTNITALLREVYDVYSNQNLGAVVLASDGIYNEGANPVYADIQLNAPVYTIGLGDTTRRKDLLLQRVFNNKIAYLGDKFSIQVDIAAINAAGANTTLSIVRLENGAPRTLLSEPLNIDKNDFFKTREFILDADRAGVNRYQIRLGNVSGEQTTLNNARDIFVDVLEARQKVLLLAHAPHPDLSAIKLSLDKGKNNQLDIAYAATFNGDIKGYDLVILHQLPSSRYPLDALTATLRERSVPTWYIVGSATNFAKLGNLQDLVILSSAGSSSNDVLAKVMPDFKLFNISDPLRNGLRSFPPLASPFGEYRTGANAATLLRQRIGSVDTEYPLLSMGDSQGRRQAVMTATGLWQWRLFDYLDKQNHDRFTEFVGQVVQYLSVNDDKRRFRVNLPKNIFDENETIIFDAELYNESYQLINTPTVQMSITSANGKEYAYTFSPSGNAYRLDAGILPVGDYRFKAETNDGKANQTFNGQFSVQPVQVEQYALTADHNLLKLLSERYGGELLAPQQMAQLAQRLKESDTIKPVIYETIQTRSAINLRWIFGILMVLLGLEWFMRRYFGAY